MSLPLAVASEALFRSRRVCCACHASFGADVSVYSIADGIQSAGLDDAVVLCDGCRQRLTDADGELLERREIEIRKLRDLWWEYCASLPVKSLPTELLRTTLNSNSANETATLAVVLVDNRDVRTLYDVQVRLRGDVRDLAAADLIEPSVTSIYPDLQQEGVQIVPDVTAAMGWDNDGTPTVIFSVRELQAGGSRKFILSLPGDSSVIDQLTAHVAHAQQSPTPLMLVGSQLAAPLILNVGFKASEILATSTMSGLTP